MKNQKIELSEVEKIVNQISEHNIWLFFGSDRSMLREALKNSWNELSVIHQNKLLEKLKAMTKFF